MSPRSSCFSSSSCHHQLLLPSEASFLPWASSPPEPCLRPLTSSPPRASSPLASSLPLVPYLVQNLVLLRKIGFRIGIPKAKWKSNWSCEWWERARIVNIGKSFGLLIGYWALVRIDELALWWACWWTAEIRFSVFVWRLNLFLLASTTFQY